MVALGDFNEKSSNWCNKDIAGNEGRKIEAVTSQTGLHQEVNEPTHILNNFSSCIDFILPSLIVESGFTHLYNQVVIIKYFLQNLT